MRIAMVAGEPSGDVLGAGLIQALKQQLPNAIFYGIGGPNMCRQGFDTWYDMERLSVMGFDEVLLRYMELNQIRNQLIKAWLHSPPDLFIGIDSSSFNLKIAGILKQNGIKTIQYVSPKVWAWRPERVVTIKQSVDLVLTLFPFEKVFYDQYQVPAVFVGHPFADEIPLEQDKKKRRTTFQLSASDQIIAFLPGSRQSDIKYMGPLFIATIKFMYHCCPQLKFLVPLPTEKLKQQFLSQLKRPADRQDNLQVMVGQTREILEIADLVFVKSGTGTLEAMLFKKPMIVAYRMGWLTHAIFKRKLYIPFVSLPNLLVNQPLVKEFIQNQAQPERLAKEGMALLQDVKKTRVLIDAFKQMHLELRLGASERAAQEIIRFLNDSQKAID